MKRFLGFRALEMAIRAQEPRIRVVRSLRSGQRLIYINGECVARRPFKHERRQGG
jgi:hypothetical protein